MKKPISTRIHGIIDYLTAIALMMLPFFFGFTTDAAGSFMMAMGVFIFAYSLFTAYELGVARIVPMRLHLALDFMGGVAFAAAPFFLVNQELEKTVLFLLIGLAEIGMAVMTQPEPELLPTKTAA